MNFNELKKKRRPGFTLVEMVVVVTILGILAGLGFMKFDQVQEKARLNADYISATNLATAANLFLNDYPDGAEKDLNKTDTIVDINKLKSENYINAIPAPQSSNGQGEFKIFIDYKDSKEDLPGISVKVGTKVFYPKITTTDTNLNSDGESGE